MSIQVRRKNIYAKRFLAGGARGFVSKEACWDELKEAIYMILNGRIYISPSLALSLANDGYSGIGNNPFDKLSPREFEIASLLLAAKKFRKSPE